MFQKVENNSINFELARGRKFSGEQCLCLGTIGLIVAPWKFDVLKRSIFALETSLPGQIFVLRTSNFRGATYQPIVQDRNTLMFKWCLSADERHRVA